MVKNARVYTRIIWWTSQGIGKTPDKPIVCSTQWPKKMAPCGRRERCACVRFQESSVVIKRKHMCCEKNIRIEGSAVKTRRLQDKTRALQLGEMAFDRLVSPKQKKHANGKHWSTHVRRLQQEDALARKFRLKHWQMSVQSRKRARANNLRNDPPATGRRWRSWPFCEQR